MLSNVFILHVGLHIYAYKIVNFDFCKEFEFFLLRSEKINTSALYTHIHCTHIHIHNTIYLLN